MVTMSDSINWFKKKIRQSREHQEKASQNVTPLIVEKRSRRYITLADQTTLIDFFSCSYLGLDLDPRVIAASNDHVGECGVTFPAARTRAQVKSFGVLEELLNTIFGDSHCVIFPALHLCHLGMLPLLGSGEMPGFPLASDGVLFVIDRTAHASLQINRALMEQFGELAVADFNVVESVEAVFKRAYDNHQTPIGICDSIGSMGGISPVRSLYTLAETYKGYLYLDDAHGTSVFGRHGCGYVLDQFEGKLPQRVILTSSLAKAFGAVAGVVVLPTQEDVNMVKRFASTYVFGGPPPLAIIDAAIASANIHLSNEIHELQLALQDNLSYFDQLIKNPNKIINYNMPSPIRGIFIGSEFKAIDFTLKLRQFGIAVSAAMYPTVDKGQSILRVTLSSDHQKADIEKLCSFINNEIFYEEGELVTHACG